MFTYTLWEYQIFSIYCVKQTCRQTCFCFIVLKPAVSMNPKANNNQKQI